MERIALPGGGCLLRSRDPLDAYAPRITDWLWHWEKAAPERPFLRERGPDGAWRGVTFGAAAAQVRALGAALLAQGLGPRRPLAVLSGNSVRHALLAYAAQAVGVACAAVSTPYSLQSEDSRQAAAHPAQAPPRAALRRGARALRPGAGGGGGEGIAVISAGDWGTRCWRRR